MQHGVLPDPVWAWTTTLSPAEMAGIVISCILVGDSNPICDRVVTTSGGTPSLRKVLSENKLHVVDDDAASESVVEISVFPEVLLVGTFGDSK